MNAVPVKVELIYGDIYQIAQWARYIKYQS